MFEALPGCASAPIGLHEKRVPRRVAGHPSPGIVPAGRLVAGRWDFARACTLIDRATLPAMWNAGDRMRLHDMSLARSAVFGQAFARNGTGAYLIASYIVRNLPDGLVGIPLGGFANEIEIAAAWRTDDQRTPIGSYLAQLRKFF